MNNFSKDNYNLIIIGGNFNLHYPLWNPSLHLTHDEDADILIEAATHLDLNLLLPAGTIIYPNDNTTIDLIWGNELGKQNFVFCITAHEHDIGSD